MRDPNTLNRTRPLNRTVAPNANAHPIDVVMAKSALGALGHYQAPEWGVSQFTDSDLFRAVQEFQKAQGLKIDGVMKPDGETWAALQNQLHGAKADTATQTAALALQDMGRGNDEILAHLTQEEAKLLHHITDGGSINPETGLMEFLTDKAREAADKAKEGTARNRERVRDYVSGKSRETTSAGIERERQERAKATKANNDKKDTEQALNTNEANADNDYGINFEEDNARNRARYRETLKNLSPLDRFAFGSKNGYRNWNSKDDPKVSDTETPTAPETAPTLDDISQTQDTANEPTPTQGGASLSSSHPTDLSNGKTLKEQVRNIQRQNALKEKHAKTLAKIHEKQAKTRTQANAFADIMRSTRNFKDIDLNATAKDRREKAWGLAQKATKHKSITPERLVMEAKVNKAKWREQKRVQNYLKSKGTLNSALAMSSTPNAAAMLPEKMARQIAWGLADQITAKQMQYETWAKEVDTLFNGDPTGQLNLAEKLSKFQVENPEALKTTPEPLREFLEGFSTYLEEEANIPNPPDPNQANKQRAKIAQKQHDKVVGRRKAEAVLAGLNNVSSAYGPEAFQSAVFDSFTKLAAGANALTGQPLSKEAIHGMNAFSNAMVPEGMKNTRSAAIGRALGQGLGFFGEVSPSGAVTSAAGAAAIDNTQKGANRKETVKSARAAGMRDFLSGRLPGAPAALNRAISPSATRSLQGWIAEQGASAAIDKLLESLTSQEDKKGPGKSKE